MAISTPTIAVESGVSTNASTYFGTTTFNPVANALLIVMCSVSDVDDPGTMNISSDIGTMGAWTESLNSGWKTVATPTMRTKIWWGIVGSTPGTAKAITIDGMPDACTGATLIVVSVASGYNATTPIVQAPVSVDDVSDATNTHTFGAYTGSTNLALTFCNAVAATAATLAVDAGWTGLGTEVGYTAPTLRSHVGYQENASDVTAVWTWTTSGNNQTCGVEIAVAAAAAASGAYIPHPAAIAGRGPLMGPWGGPRILRVQRFDTYGQPPQTFPVAVEAALTATANVVRSTGKLIAVGLTGTVAVVKSILKPIAVALTGTVVVARSILKPIAVALTGTAAVARSTLKPIAVSLTGTVVVVASHAFNVAVAVALTGTVAVVRTTNKLIVAALTGTAVVVRTTNKMIVVALTGTAVVVRRTLKSIVVGLTGTPVVVRSTGKLIAVGLTGTPAVVRRTGKAIGVGLTVVLQVLGIKTAPPQSGVITWVEFQAPDATSGVILWAELGIHAQDSDITDPRTSGPRHRFHVE
jgi:hypothetical protein